ncbi:MAG TPA: indoleamine 2,3-dioxygenase [Alphaproteobacteria bacterium]
MTDFRIENYDISAERGFLTPHDMDEVMLPGEFTPIVEAGKHLSDYMLSNRVRHFLEQLPETDMDKYLPTLDDAQLRMLMVHYSFIIQAYVWGEPEAPKKLPRNLAVPYCKLADKIGQFPLLPYSSYTLDNWAKLDRNGGIDLDNIYVIQNFYDGVDENWFILVHVEIEAKAGAALAAMPALLDAVDKKDTKGVHAGLKTILGAWHKINPVFDRMVEKCDPYIYYHRVRPYIHGWKGNPALPDGLIYEGVDKYKGQGQSFRGQTGSQSSIVPVMDALMGIGHENDPLREYLDELHAYRPPKHRLFVEEVAKRSKLRAFVAASNDAALVGLYNDIVTMVEKFRTRHLEYAASYINKQARDAEGNPTDIGTGGTPFMKYLKKHRDESGQHLLPLPGESAKRA